LIQLIDSVGLVDVPFGPIYIQPGPVEAIDVSVYWTDDFTLTQALSVEKEFYTRRSSISNPISIHIVDCQVDW